MATRAVCRIWRGWTHRSRSEAYRAYLEEELFPHMAAELGPRGYLGHQLLTREVGEETEFVALTWFASLESVRSFAGDDIGRANVSDKARSLLTRWEPQATHFLLSSARLPRP